MNTKRNFTCLRRIAGVALCAALTLMAAHAAPPAIDIPPGPVPIATAHPNVLLDLSVEFPTVGSAYRRDFDVNVSYYGYFDPKQCYKYNGSTNKPGPTDPAANPAASLYFYAYKPATAQRKCDGTSFSGSFMNWASSSAIDMLRIPMSGGNRIVDQPNHVIVQRAVLPKIFYNHPLYFPAKKISDNGSFKINELTPFKIGTLYAISCNDRILFGSTMPPDLDPTQFDRTPFCNANDYSAGSAKSQGEYLARVEVCTDAEGATRRDLCKRYPDGHYKPVGEMQKNADGMHFGVFSYLLDSSANRYGGVLRTPMKYVGPWKYDASLAKSANAAKEWDEQTGKLLPNPEADPVGRSGAINYLNQFGRTGEYKFWDPVGELYYESLRYLQGLQPTPDAVSNVDTAMADGFPVVKKWQDPIIQSCQRTSIILIGDAVTNYDYYIPGNTREVTYPDGTPGSKKPRAVESTWPATPFNVLDWTNKVGVMENTVHGADGTTRPALTNLASRATGLQQLDGSFRSSYYLAGMAYFANVTPIRKDKHDILARTYVIDVDERGSGVTDDSNTRPWTHPRDSAYYLAAKYGGYDSTNPDIGNSPIIDPFTGAPPGGKNNATGCYYYLWDRDANCDPDSYFLGSDGGKFAQSIRNIFKQVSAVAEAVSMATTSSSVVTAGTTQYIYQASFDAAGWSGDLKRRPVTYTVPTGPSTGGLVIGAPEPNAKPLVSRESDWVTGDKANESRRIYTYRGPSAAPNTTQSFSWGSLSAAQKASLDGSDNLGELRLHYLRGSTNFEVDAAQTPGKVFRPRPKDAKNQSILLGDIINSSPVYAGAPPLDVQGNGYAAFYKKNLNRKHAVYVGANDGMLHAFDPNLGTEYFGYIPKMIFPSLNVLTDPEYGHRPFVDGGIAVAEANLATSTATPDWRTVLAASMGGGAQGVFALDVTNPDTFNAATGALWEFTDADDSDMGNLFAAPSVAKITTGVDGAGRRIHEYFVVAASGVNNYVADGNAADATKTSGALFLLKVGKPAGQAWKLGSNYFKYLIPSADPAGTRQGGLSAPTLVPGNDGAVQLAYGGDLQGNVWRLAFGNKAYDATLKKIFKAELAGQAQPITTPPQVAFAPDGGRLLMFGTGKYIEASDVNSPQQQSFYAVADYPAADYKGALTRADLKPRTLTFKNGGQDVAISGTAASFASNKADKGWYADFLPAPGVPGAERSVTPAVLAYGRVFFNTLIPPSTEDCPPASSGRAYALDILSGLGSEANGITGHLSTGGIAAAPMIFDTRATAKADRPPANAIGKRVVPRTYSKATLTGKTDATTTNHTVDLVAGRLSWREVLNYKDLRDAASP